MFLTNWPISKPFHNKILSFAIFFFQKFWRGHVPYGAGALRPATKILVTFWHAPSTPQSTSQKSDIHHGQSLDIVVPAKNPRQVGVKTGLFLSISHTLLSSAERAHTTNREGQLDFFCFVIVTSSSTSNTELFVSLPNIELVLITKG